MTYDCLNGFQVEVLDEIADYARWKWIQFKTSYGTIIEYWWYNQMLTIYERDPTHPDFKTEIRRVGRYYRGSRHEPFTPTDGPTTGPVIQYQQSSFSWEEHKQRLPIYLIEAQL